MRVNQNSCTDKQITNIMYNKHIMDNYVKHEGDCDEWEQYFIDSHWIGCAMANGQTIYFIRRYVNEDGLAKDNITSVKWISF